MDSSSKIIAVIMVIVLTTGALVMFGLMQLFDDPNDKYRVDRDYTVSGDYGGMAAEGTGHTRYYDENSAYLYEVTTTYEYTEGGVRKVADAPTFTVICGSDRKVSESLYTKTGTAVYGDTQCDVWEYCDGSMVATFAIDDVLCVHEYSIAAGGLNLKAVLVQT